ncbi:hypothetical protein ACFQ1S_36040 [Kibdelosporangium lantanae]|uniref:Uncharacterized protein n=1 Tax=Kibdelosporangium lantanae TaxID=1497396 RepID=A0ABW3MKJ2_9PSEU
MIGYVKTFAPWIVFAVLATSDDSRWGALAAVVLALVMLVIDRRGGKQWDALIIECGSDMHAAPLAPRS